MVRNVVIASLLMLSAVCKGADPRCIVRRAIIDGDSVLLVQYINQLSPEELHNVCSVVGAGKLSSLLQSLDDMQSDSDDWSGEFL